MREAVSPPPALNSQESELLELIAHGARVFETARGLQLVSPMVHYSTLTESTVRSLIAHGYLARVESYGAGQSLWEITAVGKERAAEVHE